MQYMMICILVIGIIAALGMIGLFVVVDHFENIVNRFVEENDIL